MKKLLSSLTVLALVACTAGRAAAQPSFVKNVDLASLGVTEGYPSPASVDDYGRVAVISSTTGLGDISAVLNLAPILTATDTAEASSTVTVINATSHAAAVGDYVQFTGGTAGNIGLWRRVRAVTANTITVAAALPTAPANNDAFSIYRAQIEPAHANLTSTATAEIAAGSLTNTYAVILTNSAKLRRCIFNNGTDVAVSFDDGTAPIIEYLPAGQIFIDEYAVNGRWLATNIRVKEVTNATSGQVSVNCYS